MMSKFLILALLITFEFAYGREVAHQRTNNELISTENEGRIIDVPLIGGLILLACQVVSVITSKVLSLLEYKLAFLSLVPSVISWLKQHYILVIIGTVAVVGLCAVTGIFSSEPVYEIDQIVRTARSLDQGIVKYSKLI